MIQNARRLIIAGSGLAVAALSFKLGWRHSNERSALGNKLNENASKDPLEVKGQDVLIFPWHEPADSLEEPENWEYRKVKLRGRLSKTTHFVFEARNGVPGYLVFKVLLTGKRYGTPMPQVANPGIVPAQTGIMVNLGWVPKNKAAHVGFAEVDFLKKPKVDEEAPYLFPQAADPYTGIVHNAVTEDELEFPMEGHNAEEVFVTGFLRKPAPPSRWRGRRRWSVLMTSVIDLDRMSAFHMLANAAEARQYYLQAAVPQKLDKIAQNNLVVPISFLDSKSHVEAALKELGPGVSYSTLGALATLGALSSLVI